MRPDIGMSEILPLRFVGSIPALSNMYSIQLYVKTSFPVIYGRSKVVSRYPVSLINNTIHQTVIKILNKVTLNIHNPNLKQWSRQFEIF